MPLGFGHHQEGGGSRWNSGPEGGCVSTVSGELQGAVSWKERCAECLALSLNEIE